MQSLRKRILLGILIISAFGIATIAVTSLGVASHTGKLGSASVVEPYALQAGKGLYLLVFSGEVAEGISGAVKVTLDGNPAMDYRLVNLAPLRYFAKSHGDGLHDGTLTGLKPGDKLALLVLMQPQMVRAKGFEVPIASCCVPPEMLSSKTGKADPQPLTVNFVAAGSGKPLLQIPVIFYSAGT